MTLLSPLMVKSSCDRCIGPEKDFLIQLSTSLANDVQAGLSLIHQKHRFHEVTLITKHIMKTRHEIPEQVASLVSRSDLLD